MIENITEDQIEEGLDWAVDREIRARRDYSEGNSEDACQEATSFHAEIASGC